MFSKRVHQNNIFMYETRCDHVYMVYNTQTREIIFHIQFLVLKHFKKNYAHIFLIDNIEHTCRSATDVSSCIPKWIHNLMTMQLLRLFMVYYSPCFHGRLPPPHSPRVRSLCLDLIHEVWFMLGISSINVYLCMIDILIVSFRTSGCTDRTIYGLLLCMVSIECHLRFIQ